MPPTCSVCSNSILTGPDEVSCLVCKSVAHRKCTSLSQNPSNKLVQEHICNHCEVDCTQSLNISHFNALMGRLDDLKDGISECKQNINACQQSISNLNEQIATHASQIALCINNISDLKIEHDDLATKVEKIANSGSPEGFSMPEMYAETCERIKRENNIIVFGLPELNATSHSDMANTLEILNLLNIGKEVQISSVSRIGKPVHGKNRPIRAEMSKKYIVRDILRNKNNLCRKTYPNISIKADQTPLQMQELNNLRKELDSLKRDGKSVTIRYINNVPKIVAANENVNSSKRNRDEEISPPRHRGSKSSKNTTTSQEK